LPHRFVSAALFRRRVGQNRQQEAAKSCAAIELVNLLQSADGDGVGLRAHTAARMDAQMHSYTIVLERTGGRSKRDEKCDDHAKPSPGQP
jgi:hypothetical protein